MPVLGPRAAVDLAIPAGIDGGRIFEFEVLRGSVTATQLIADAAARLGQMNERIMATYGRWMYVTPEMYSIYRQGDGNRSITPTAVEYARTDPRKTGQVGHMLDYNDYVDALAWTPDYLRDAYRGQTDGDLDSVAEAWWNRFEVSFFDRLFSTSEIALSSGYAVPWAIGTGTNVNYIPPAVGSRVFTSAHTHFNFANTSSSGTWITLLNAMMLNLKEHGQLGRTVALVSEDDIAAIKTALGSTTFVDLIPSDVLIGPNSASTSVMYYQTGEFEGQPGELFGAFRGTYGVTYLAAHNRVPTGYAFMSRLGEVNSRANPVAVRIHPSIPFGMRVNPVVLNVYNPELERIEFKATFGVNVGLRLGGVAGQIGAGVTSYTSPTITE
jgi:hypothetical protein